MTEEKKERSPAALMAYSIVQQNLKGLVGELRGRANRLEEFIALVDQEWKDGKDFRDTALMTNVVREFTDACRNNYVHSSVPQLVESLDVLVSPRSGIVS